MKNVIKEQSNINKPFINEFSHISGRPPRSSSTRLRLNVLDLDDNKATFSSKTFTFHVLENEPPGTDVGIVSAEDKDSAPHNQFVFALLPQESSSQRDSRNQEDQRMLFEIQASRGSDYGLGGDRPQITLVGGTFHFAPTKPKNFAPPQKSKMIERYIIL